MKTSMVNEELAPDVTDPDAYMEKSPSAGRMGKAAELSSYPPPRSSARAASSTWPPPS